MRAHIDLLTKLELFAGMEGEIERMLHCLNARTRAYARREALFLAGDRVTSIGIVLSGEIKVVSSDSLGNENIIAQFPRGNLFAEAFACAQVSRIPVSVIAVEDCEVLFLDYQKILAPCASSCTCHKRLIENLLSLIAHKNMLLSQKIELLSQRSIRERVYAYLETQRNAAGQAEFTIPFDRASLADYLCVNKSALSRELSLMRDQGVIEFHKNRFTLREGAPLP